MKPNVGDYVIVPGIGPARVIAFAITHEITQLVVRTHSGREYITLDNKNAIRMPRR